MNNIHLLFEYNKNNDKILKLTRKKLVYTCPSKEVNGSEIRKIIKFINTVKNKYEHVKLPIELNFPNVTFADKLTYIILECICYYLCIDQGYPFSLNIKMSTAKNQIFTEGIRYSPLAIIANRKAKYKDNFMEKFSVEIYGNHYRKIIRGDTLITSNYLGILMNDIDLFLQHLGVSDDYSIELSETVSELIGNAVEHTKTDCLVDIDVTENTYKKRGESDGVYYGINVVVLNFSDKFLGDGLKNRIENNKSLKSKYIQVKEAYTNHSRFFGTNYNKYDFYSIASFQDQISGNENKILSGGVGLTRLIKSLESKSNAHDCYMMTGNRVLYFIHEYLEYDNDGWIGFNDEKDFLSHKPSSKSISSSKVSFPGTAYNLNFAIRKED